MNLNKLIFVLVIFLFAQFCVAADELKVQPAISAISISVNDNGVEKVIITDKDNIKIKKDSLISINCQLDENKLNRGISSCIKAGVDFNEDSIFQKEELCKLVSDYTNGLYVFKQCNVGGEIGATKAYCVLDLKNQDCAMKLYLEEQKLKNLLDIIFDDPILGTTVTYVGTGRNIPLIGNKYDSFDVKDSDGAITNLKIYNNQAQQVVVDNKVIATIAVENKNIAFKI